jgi:hypothetical protein
MSLVIARQFGDRICILSDTMISDRNAPKDDVIPGQLKTIVLKDKISISYSGSVNPAIIKIREIRKQIYKEVSLDKILESLSKFTLEKNGEVDFIVASHVSTPSLYKIAIGQINKEFDYYWIGDAEAANLVQQEIDKNTEDLKGLPDYVSQEESKFGYAFRKMVEEHQVPNVGGVVFKSIGSPYGHCYQNFSMAMAWDAIVLGDGFDEKARRAHEKTGTACYKLAVCSANERGLAVTGAYFDQNEIGFLYSTLDSDLDEEMGRVIGKPRKYHPISHEEFDKELQNYASRLEKSLGI